MIRYAILFAAAGKPAGNRWLIPKSGWSISPNSVPFPLAAAFSYPVIIETETGN